MLNTTSDKSAGARTQVLFVMNKKTNRAAMFDASCFEELQMMSRVGIGLPNGETANAIGRCKSVADFTKRAAKGETEILFYDTDKLEIIPANGREWIVVSPYIFRSWSGKRRINGQSFNAPVFYLGTGEIAANQARV